METGGRSAASDYIKAGDLKVLEGLAPLSDPIFQYLVKLALGNNLPVYWAVIPIRLIHPFDENYRPQNHPNGQLAIGGVIRQWEAGASPAIRVYPNKGCFIMSDDYIYYEAALIAGINDLPCIVLGDTFSPGVTQVQGPLPKEEVPKALGFC
jgi:hypothetical protein